MKIQSLILTVFLSPILAFATPTDTSVSKLAEIVPYEALFFENIVAPLEQEKMVLAYTLSHDPTLSDDTRQKALQTFDNYAENLIKKFDTKAYKDKLKKAYINSAKANFSQAEIDAQIAFYGSPTGQSALQKTDKVYDEFLQALTDDTQKILMDYQKNNSIKMQDDIKRILGK